MKTAVAYLCVTPTESQLVFYKETSTYHDVYVVCDSNKNIEEMGSKYPELTFVWVEEEECIAHGFANACVKYKPATSWEKALYYLTKTNIQNDYVWFIEDDVFVPASNTLAKLDEKYKQYNADLLAKNLYKYDEKSRWVHWSREAVRNNVASLFELPWYHGLICAARFSKDLLEKIGKLASTHKTLCFIEVLFHTTAMSNNMSVKACNELLTLKAPQGGKFDYERTLTKFSSNVLYHPIKNRETHQVIRENLID